MKKSVIFISISLVIIILLGIGVSYSMWNISVSQDTTNLAESKCFDLSITNQENNISLDNAYPISNDKGKSLTPFTFTVTNTCDITTEYSVNLEVLNSSTLSSNFIDVMFEGNINLLSSYDTTDKVNTSSIESRKLATGILKSQKSKDYSLRLWIDYNTTLEDLNNEVKSFKSKIIIVGKPINFNYDGDMVFNFDYTGAEQTFVAPVSGTYKLETWGAQGNSTTGAYGAYSTGTISLNKGDKLYINVGGTTTTTVGGYNGGGTGNHGGGGATHIATTSGLLSTLSSKKDKILIVSGGGGGAGQAGAGGSAGGIQGVRGVTGACPDNGGYGGTQTAGGSVVETYWAQVGSFGRGGNAIQNQTGGAGGSGYFGGGSGTSGSCYGGGGGGSSYIGNSLLSDKAMYCYNCTESSETATKTVTTTCSEETPTRKKKKKGNGYARITLVSIDE